MNRVAEVNRELKRLNIPDRLRRGKGYYYFTGPVAEKFHTQSVAVFRADVLPVERWLYEYNCLKNDARNA